MSLRLLCEFINEEIAFNYWMRRPRNSKSPDVSAEIETQRQAVFDQVSDDAKTRVDALRHTITTSMSIKQMMGAVRSFGDSIEDSIDPAMLKRAIDDDDVDEVRRQLISGLERWEVETMKWSEHNNYDTSSLVGHPMRTPNGGGNAFKKKNGP